MWVWENPLEEEEWTVHDSGSDELHKMETHMGASQHRY